MLLTVTEGSVSPLSLLRLYSWLPDPCCHQGSSLRSRVLSSRVGPGEEQQMSHLPLLHTHLPHLSVPAELGTRLKGRHMAVTPQSFWVLVLGTAGKYYPGWGALPGLSGCLASLVK